MEESLIDNDSPSYAAIGIAICINNETKSKKYLSLLSNISEFLSFFIYSICNHYEKVYQIPVLSFSHTMP